MIQLSIREGALQPCRSWSEAHAWILDSFDQDGHTSFHLTEDGFEWAEEGMHWRMFDAVASTPEVMRGYFQVVGRF